MWASLASRLLWLWLLWIPCSGGSATLPLRFVSEKQEDEVPLGPQGGHALNLYTLTAEADTLGASEAEVSRILLHGATKPARSFFGASGPVVSKGKRNSHRFARLDSFRNLPGKCFGSFGASQRTRARAIEKSVRQSPQSCPRRTTNELRHPTSLAQKLFIRRVRLGMESDEDVGIHKAGSRLEEVS